MKSHEQREKKPVLVVSDDSIVRDLLALILKRHGFKTMIAARRSEAAAAEAGGAVQAYFVDARAISAESRGFLSELRARGHIGRTVLIADARDDEFLSSAMASGAAAILTQPFEGDAVAEIMQVVGGGRS